MDRIPNEHIAEWIEFFMHVHIYVVTKVLKTCCWIRTIYKDNDLNKNYFFAYTLVYLYKTLQKIYVVFD